MYIEKVLNNNVVLSHDQLGREIIVMGRGLAFQKRPGQLIDEAVIEKIFTLKDDEIRTHLKAIMANIPMDYMLVTEKIIQYATSVFNKKLSDSLYVALTDHIYQAVERIKKGIVLKNGLLWEIKKFYKDEFVIGKEALRLIKETFEVSFDEDEAAFIALHIVNAQLDTEMNTVMNITNVIHETLNIVREHFQVTFDEENTSYYRFITHLKLFAQRIFSGMAYDVSPDQELYELIKSKYVDAYKCTQKISQWINERYGYKVAEEEEFYFMIHLSHMMHQMALDKKKQ